MTKIAVTRKEKGLNKTELRQRASIEILRFLKVILSGVFNF